MNIKDKIYNGIAHTICYGIPALMIKGVLSFGYLAIFGEKREPVMRNTQFESVYQLEYERWEHDGSERTIIAYDLDGETDSEGNKSIEEAVIMKSYNGHIFDIEYSPRDQWQHLVSEGMKDEELKFRPGENTRTMTQEEQESLDGVLNTPIKF